MALTFLLTFSMIMSPTANQDNRTLSPNLGVRNAYTESEIQAVNTISNLWNGEIGTAHLGRLKELPGLNIKVKGIDNQLYNADFSDIEDELVLMISKEITEHAFLLNGSTYRLDYNLQQLLTRQGFSKIYDCGSVSAFRR